jgi:erythromycin esterase-like protein
MAHFSEAVAIVKTHAERLPDDIDDPEFASVFDRFATGAKVVLIGDGSHGTSEFYRARAAITKRLIERHGFRIVGAEADWPDARVLDKYAHQRDGHRKMASPFTGAFRRFPR